MKIFLVSFTNQVSSKNSLIRSFLEDGLEGYNLYILESFQDIKTPNSMTGKTLKRYMDMNIYKDFLLDSGAFTYLNGADKNVDWNRYIEDYAELINSLDIKYFFELDIDSIIGLSQVEKLRDKLERLTGKKCIPVWHKSRGIQYYKDMCREYDYIAIGGIVTKEIVQSEYVMFSPLLKIARQHNTKVHGLGFTWMKYFNKYNFYSTDSTSWKSGPRYGTMYLFKDGRLSIKVNSTDKKINHYNLSLHNFKEWLKMSKYAERYL